MNTKLLVAVGLMAVSFAAPSIVAAGEVTGGPVPMETGMRGHARSLCGFSGLEEKFLNDARNEKPGRLTQTPHYQVTKDGPTFPPPGTPGTACNPSGG